MILIWKEMRPVIVKSSVSFRQCDVVKTGMLVDWVRIEYRMYITL